MKSAMLRILEALAIVGCIGMVISLFAWYSAQTGPAHAWALGGAAISAVVALSCTILVENLKQQHKQTSAEAQIGPDGNNAN